MSEDATDVTTIYTVPLPEWRDCPRCGIHWMVEEGVSTDERRCRACQREETVDVRLTAIEERLDLLIRSNPDAGTTEAAIALLRQQTPEHWAALARAVEAEFPGWCEAHGWAKALEEEALEEEALEEEALEEEAG